MIAEAARYAFEELKKEGLVPTPEDAIRINAFALRSEEATAKKAGRSQYLLPRVAVIGDRLTLRQPTVGHEIWIDAVLRFVKPDDHETRFAINCYALSMPQDELPSAFDVEAVSAATKEFCSKFADVTREVLFAALTYVRFGADARDGEAYPNSATDVYTVSPDECVAIGVLRNGIAILSGLSLADMKEMTTRELQDAIDVSLAMRGRPIQKEEEVVAVGQFNDVVAEIADRLRREKDGAAL